jgi:Ca-activated chloride channel family protein
LKIELEKLVDAMPGNKMGLIAFAGSSALISPLTTDPSALKMYIQSLDTHSVTNQGTNFQVALSYAREAFEKGGITQSEQVKATRVILILSDGEDQDKNALEEAKKLSEDGVYILTVAYGTEKGGTIPSRDYMGNLIGSKKDKSGQVIVTQVHGDFLKELAQAAHGSFFTSQFGGNHVREIEDKINQFEKTQFASNMNVQYDEKFMYPLCLGFCLLLLSFYISTRKRQTAVWKSLYEK